jgi:hypothetical protein
VKGASGDQVILTQYGSAPLAQCMAPGQVIITSVMAGAKGIAYTTPFTTVYVTADAPRPHEAVTTVAAVSSATGRRAEAALCRS